MSSAHRWTGLSSLLEVARTDDSLQTWRELEPDADDRSPPDVGRRAEPPTPLPCGWRAGGRGPAGCRPGHLAWEEVGRLRASTALTVITDITATRVIGDRMALSQVLRNLCDNAARHARTTVKITATPVGASALWVVEDDGSGVREG